MYPWVFILFIPGLTSARIHPYLYGVPRFIDIGENHLGDIDPLAAADNSTSINSTAAPAPPTASLAQLSPGLAEPCAVVSSALAALPSDARRVVPADLGLQCLESVPLDKNGNILLINELKLYLQWQSNLAYLKNPPPGYTEAPVDILSELDKIAKRLSVDAFHSEYQFQLEVMDLIEKGYDNHLAWQPDIVAGVMQFQRTPGIELVSISIDGLALPEIFAYRDIELANRDSSFKPSAVRTINGQGAREYLEGVALQADFHDADTRWNALFPSQAILATGVNYLGAFRSGKYAGPTTTITFANGTSRTDMNLAVVFGDFSGVDSGRKFFDTFCTGAPPPPVMTTTPTSSKTAPTPTQIGYPKPVIIHPDGAVAGYYLEGRGYEDVAVLSIPSFLSPDVNLFQSIIREFITASVDAGKTKLIFDMRGNGGGNAVLGLDTFKQVFPQRNLEPFVASRYRAHEALNIAGRVVSDFNQGTTFVQRNQTAFDENFVGNTPEDLDLYTSVFNYQHNLNIDLEAFDSWDEMYGPIPINNDSFTTEIRYNLSDDCSYTYPGFSVTGFLNNTNASSTQPFRAENMIMLHDGMCSSTCAITSELLKTQGRVKTVVVGGRPQFGPMQGVGGTKGAQSFEWDDIQIRTEIVFSLGSPEQQAAWNKTALGRTAFASQIFKRTSYNGGRPSGGINLRDSLRRSDKSQTPLEFVYDAADCRMWFTAPMIHDVRALWKEAVDTMWKSQRCVQGSTGDQSSVSGGGEDGSGQRPSLQQGASSHSTHMLPSYRLLGWSMASGIVARVLWR